MIRSFVLNLWLQAEQPFNDIPIPMENHNLLKFRNNWSVAWQWQILLRIRFLKDKILVNFSSSTYCLIRRPCLFISTFAIDPLDKCNFANGVWTLFSHWCTHLEFTEHGASCAKAALPFLPLNRHLIHPILSLFPGSALRNEANESQPLARVS